MSTSNDILIRNEDRPNAQLRLFCFTFAGSSAQVFFDWNDYAPEWLEISGFELPGHGRRLVDSKLVETHAEAAVLIADALSPMLDQPYALYGHCLGGILAYEATRVLSSRGERQPVHLFTSGARGPHLGIPIADVEAMNDEQFIEHFSQVYGAPISLLNDPYMRPLLLPMMRTAARMTQRYRYAPGPPVTYNITAVAGEQDPYVQMCHLEGWRQHTTANVVTRLYPGGHFFFIESASRIIADLSEQLEPQLASRFAPS
jgi:medium-chain acyl-[acyl-carrier-protein] hydrolase